MTNRPAQLPAERRDNLQSQLQQRPGNIQDGRQDWADNRREDWQDFADNNHWNHGDWYHGCWNGHGGGWWDHMWDDHPAAAAVGLTWWGVNRMSSWYGYSWYYNPYYTAPATGTTVINYSEPIVVMPQETAATTPPKEGDQAAATAPPAVTPDGSDTLNQARSTFYEGKYSDALKLADETLKSMPKDAVVHEFRALVLFALKRYTDAAAAINAVLAVGPGWDWTTMISLYPDVATYTAQLRALEAARSQNPKAADARFLLAYHYLTAGHNDAAVAELKQVVQLQPKDGVAAHLLSSLTPPSESPAPAKPAPAAEAKPIPAEQLVGTWTASGPNNAKYSMSLTGDGNFTWGYAAGSKKQQVKGVYAIDGANLAMEPDGGGSMVAELALRDASTLHFAMVGAPENDPGLDFRRAAGK